jgi:hypothetical protein
LPFERSQDRGSRGGILLHLFVIATDDVASPGERHSLGLVVDILIPLCKGERDKGSGVVEYKLAHEFVGALANAKNIQKPARFEFGDRFGADHAAIGDDTDATNGKAFAQPVDYRNEAARVGGVARPHLRADRPTVAVEQHGEDHLIEIRPMVLGEAALSKGLAALSLEIQAGRVHEHEIELAEQIAPAREQVFLDNVLHATRCKGRSAILLIRAQFLAEPSHRPVEMMQVEAFNAIDRVILAPTLRRPIGAAGK